MAELQPPDIPLSADPPPISSTATSSAPPPPPPPPLLPPPADNLTSTTIAPTTTVTSTSNLGLAPKRQRRPSVRLGEIGDQSYDQSHTHHPRRPKTWRFHKDPSLAAKTSKTRPLTNLVNGGHSYHHPPPLNHNDDTNNYSYDFGTKKPKPKKPTKRVRSNWPSATAAKLDSSANGAGGIAENDSVFRDDNLDNNVNNDDFRDFDAEEEEEEEGSESPLKEQLSPVHSMDNHNMGLQFWDRRSLRARLSNSESLDHRHDNNTKNINFNNTMNGIQNEMNSGDENRSSSGVRDWLIGLGLGRYAPVFEIHEVDDEVLPMLTLEDLKDMGINAVGSRRKMYSAILKLRKGFS